MSGNLDRIQIVKVWLDGAGKRQEKVYDAVWSGDRKPDCDGKLPLVGNTVDVANATWTNTIGSPELIAVWTDPEFEPKVSAAYYARVLEIPTPRWTAYEAKRFGIKMKKTTKVFCFLLSICSLLFSSCASTTITDTWKDKTYQGKAQNMVVMMVARTQYLRDMFEGQFAAELRAQGNKATQSHKFVPFEELKDKELVKAKIKSTDADTILIARLVDRKTIEAYEPGHIHGVPLYHSYWGTYYEIVSVDYGYTGDIEVSYIETNLYDVKTEKLIWSARSKTERSYGEQQLINTFIDIILKKLSSDKIIH